MPNSHNILAPKHARGHPIRGGPTTKPLLCFDSMHQSEGADRLNDVHAKRRRELEAVFREAIASQNPQDLVRQRLKELQAAQQLWFTSLPFSVCEDEWVQELHGEMLRMNQSVHDAALAVLGSLATPNLMLSSAQSA